LQHRRGAAAVLRRCCGGAEKVPPQGKCREGRARL